MREAAMLLIVEGILYVMRDSVQFQCNAPGTGAVMSLQWRRSCNETPATSYMDVCRQAGNPF